MRGSCVRKLRQETIRVMFLARLVTGLWDFGVNAPVITARTLPANTTVAVTSTIHQQ
jgi:hypothetical protein